MQMQMQIPISLWAPPRSPTADEMPICCPIRVSGTPSSLAEIISDRPKSREGDQGPVDDVHGILSRGRPAIWRKNGMAEVKCTHGALLIGGVCAHRLCDDGPGP